MNIKNFINNLFEQNYNFSIINNKDDKIKSINNNHTSIYPEINKNLEFIQSKYNTLINSDIVIREFETLAQNQLYKSFIIYIDGLVNSISINDFVLEPLMFPKRVQNPNPANLLIIDYCLKIVLIKLKILKLYVLELIWEIAYFLLIL